MDFETRIAQYRQLRDIIKADDDAHKKRMEPKRKVLDQLGDMLLSMLNQSKQESAATTAGTAYKTRKVSATIADATAFKRHVIGTEDWDLIDWRANKTATEQFVKDNKAPPPGINYQEMFKVGVRKPGSTTEEDDT
jgi:hypothetical protein